MATQFTIDNLAVSCAKKVANSKMTLCEAGDELYRHGWFNYRPSEDETRNRLNTCAAICGTDIKI